MISVSVSIPGLLKYICAAQRTDGGWGYAGTASWTEPTTFALLALASGSSARSNLDAGIAWLERTQRSDGGWPPHPEVAESTWVTAPAAILMHKVGDHRRAQQGRAWLMRVRGIEPDSSSILRRLLLGTPPTRETDAWPWIPRTAGWVTPTALAILALETAWDNREAADRIQTGRKTLLGRACADGGWNYGAAKALGYSAPSYPENTGQVLLALHSETGTAIDRAIQRAEADLPKCRGAQAVSWLSLGLLAHGRVPGDVLTRPVAIRSVMDASMLTLAREAAEGRRVL